YGTRDQQEKQLQDFFQNQENRDQYQKFIVTGSGKVEPFHKELRYLVETFPYNVPHATRVVEMDFTKLAGYYALIDKNLKNRIRQTGAIRYVYQGESGTEYMIIVNTGLPTALEEAIGNPLSEEAKLAIMGEALFHEQAEVLLRYRDVSEEGAHFLASVLQANI